jgi:hypothetical protein
VRKFRIAAGLAAAGGALGLALGVAAAPAGAATNACGDNCIDVSFLATGHHELLKDHSGLTGANNPIAVTNASNAMPAEDFSYEQVGEVDTLYCTSGGTALAGSVFTNNQCALLNSDDMGSDETYQLAFNPDNGGPESMCLGDWDNDVSLPSGWKARLEPCGVNAATVLIGAQSLFGATLTGDEYWMVSGASDNFSNPLVLTVTATSSWQSPRWETLNLNGKSGVDTQIVRASFGPYTH